jgi:nucleotide-binding universal stress UspA family protein
MAEIAWKRILCPVDFSQESRAALRVAIDLCRRLGAGLTLFHVRDPAAPRIGPQDKPAGRLDDWEREARHAGVTQVASAEVEGDPKLAIAEQADGGGFDLVVMGTHGRTGRDRSFAGSVTETTVRNVGCPVLAVHAEWAARP